MSIKQSFPKQALTELAFTCATNGLTEACYSISEGIAAIYESSPLPFLLKAVSQLNSNKPLVALKLLEDNALPLDPENPTIKVLIGYAHICSGHYEKGYSLLKPLSNESANNDQPSRALALEFLAA
ncbi:hypothetical protein ACU6U9_07730 [Pseudomonas sp. HK3]|jgi:hypothetical protein